MADVSVRPARVSEAGEIARIQVETWRLAYAAILPAAVLAGLSVDAGEPVWSAAISAPPSPRHHVLVAQEQDWVVGFVASGPADDLEDGDPDQQATVAVGPLLVEPRWGRRGHGSRLLAAAVDHARADAMVRAIAWLPEADEASRSFFGSAGWSADGYARGLDTGAGQLREVRIHASLRE
jgi:GNAT superfamily N-acetyltransferase